MIPKRLFQFLIIASLLLAGVGSAPPPVFTAKAQPILAELAAQNPAQLVRVIVQQMAGATGAEAQVAKLGGKVTQDLHIINAFAAEMTAEAAVELARSEAVRWVSLDAPVSQSQSTDTHVFTTWSNKPGAKGTTCESSVNMYDSALGNNSTYGYCNDDDSYWGGFQAEITPGQSIVKVEVVLYVYAIMPLSASDVIELSFWKAGKLVSDYTMVDPSMFANRVGAANVGLVAIDVTSSRASWLWSDFDALELEFDQYRFNTKHYLYFDAIGLRVTSLPGTDTTSDTGGDTSSLVTIDASKQVNFYNQVIRSSNLWNTGAKLQGKGVTIAVVDSGVFKTKDLDKRVRTSINFNPAYHDATDRYGHGTFVAGIIAGNGSSSSKKYIGVAPRADVINVRVSDDQGMSTESDVVNALQWVLNNKSKYNIRVVNLSLNSSLAQSYHTSPLDAACEILWFNGIVVVVSAGNNGTATLFPPANDPFVITVGATDNKATLSTSDDTIATFSAYGVTEGGFAKPDLVAPGRLIVGLLPENNKLGIGLGHPSNRVDNTYFKMSGTSVSAPMVSGAVALLLQDEPKLTPDQVKYRLMATANKTWAGYNAATAGAGYMDAYAAVYGTTTQSANTGLLPSLLLATGEEAVDFNSVGWNSVGWNSVGWNSVGWNSVGWNSVGWNSVGWNSDYWGP